MARNNSRRMDKISIEGYRGLFGCCDSCRRCYGGDWKYAMKYTEKIHAKRLLGMLNKKNPRLCCPFQNFYYSRDHNPKRISSISCIDEQEDVCRVCTAFVGLDWDNGDSCPCDELGYYGALKRTYIALEEKGYI